MGSYKYLIAQFTFYDRTGICRILEQYAEKGWVLDKVTNYAWRLRRMEPKKLHYARSYGTAAGASRVLRPFRLDSGRHHCSDADFLQRIGKSGTH